MSTLSANRNSLANTTRAHFLLIYQKFIHTYTQSAFGSFPLDLHPSLQVLLASLSAEWTQLSYAHLFSYHPLGTYFTGGLEELPLT